MSTPSDGSDSLPPPDPGDLLRWRPEPKDLHGYELLDELIGAGAFGKVWKARASGGKVVALKVIESGHDRLAREKEFRALNKFRDKELSHPFLVNPHDWWIDSQGRLIVVMDKADGNLSDRERQHRELTGQPGIPREELLQYIRESADALDYIHQRGIIHRDIKPANILFREDHALVADLGLAKDNTAESLTHKSGAAGTPFYLAPEACRKAVPQSDQFALAKTYAELRLGRELLTRGKNERWVPFFPNESPDLSELPSPERRVLEKALAPDPKKRYPSCLEMAHALQQAAELTGSGILGHLRAMVGIPARSSSRPRVTPGSSRTTPRLPSSTRPRPDAARPSTPAQKSTPRPDSPREPGAPPPDEWFGTVVAESPPSPQASQPAAPVARPQGAPLPPAVPGESSVASPKDSLPPKAKEPTVEDSWPELSSTADGPPGQATEALAGPGPSPVAPGASRLALALGEIVILGLVVVVVVGIVALVTRRIISPPTPSGTAGPPSTGRSSVGDTKPPPVDSAQKAREAFNQLLVSARSRQWVQVQGPPPEDGLKAEEKECWNGLVALACLAQLLPKHDVAAEREPLAKVAKWLGPEDHDDALFAEERKQARELLGLFVTGLVGSLDQTRLDSKQAEEDARNLAQYVRGEPALAAKRYLELSSALRDLQEPGGLEKRKAALSRSALHFGAAPPLHRQQLGEGILQVATLPEAEKLLEGAPAKPAEFQHWVLFAQALSWDRKGSCDQAAPLLVTLLQGQAAFPSPLQDRPRQEDAARILAKASQQMRAVAARPLQHPFTDQAKGARDACTWLTLVQERLSGTAAVKQDGLQATLALAAWYQEPPNRPQAASLSAALLAPRNATDRPAERLKADYLPLHLVNARANSNSAAAAPARLGALASYAELVRRTQDRDTGEAPRDLIEEGIALGEDLRRGTKAAERPGLGKLLAFLYKARAGLPSRTPQEMCVDLQKAHELDPDALDVKAELVRHSQRPVDAAGWDTLLAQAEAMRDQARNDPRLHQLLGHLLHQRARWNKKSQGTIALDFLKRAIDAYDQGIQAYRAGQGRNGADSESLLARLLVGRSTCHVEYANYANLSASVKSKYLLQARDDAREATRLKRDDLEYAWLALGNALEDIALLLKENPQGNYAEAAHAFEKAVAEREDRPEYLVNLGRCQYRWVAWGRADPKKISADEKKIVEQARRTLQKVRDRHAKSRAGVEASLFLARLCRDLDSDEAGAVQVYDATFDLAERHDPETAPLAAAEGLALVWDAMVRQQGKDEAGRQQVRTWAERVLKDPKSDHAANAAYYLGKSYEYEEKWKEAIAAYQRGLPADLKDAGPRHFLLLLASVDCFLLLPAGDSGGLELASFLQQAERAATIAGEDGAAAAPSLGKHYRARALANLGLIHIFCASKTDKDEEQLKLREQARDSLQNALDLAPQHTNKWTWKFYLARQLVWLHKQPNYSTQEQDYRAKAAQLFREVIDDPGASSEAKTSSRDRLKDLAP